MISSGMGGMDSFRYMAHDAGGDECVGHTAKDHLNCVNTIKMEAGKGGDAQNMVDMLHAQIADWRKKEKNDEFQCSRKIPHSALPLAGLLGHAAKWLFGLGSL
ncbi:hypothetical protein ACS0TY_029756 [Phlomoides rotata]